MTTTALDDRFLHLLAEHAQALAVNGRLLSLLLDLDDALLLHGEIPAGLRAELSALAWQVRDLDIATDALPPTAVVEGSPDADRADDDPAGGRGAVDRG